MPRLDNRPAAARSDTTKPGSAVLAAPAGRNAPRVPTPDAGQRFESAWLVKNSVVWEGLQRLGGAVGLLLSLPLVLVAFALVKLTSRGPFLFAQLRRGYGGEPFRVYKVRTLYHDTERQTALGVGRGEALVTPVGRVLRKLKLDELPQFWNLLNGTMSVVGPRPLPIALEYELEQQIPFFAERHRVKPGLTSFGQVTIVENRTGADLVADWSERFEAELHYIRNKSVVYDLVVIALTALYVARSALFFRRGRRTAALVDAPTTTRVLGTPICNLGYEGVEDRVADWVARAEQRYVALCPVHSVVEAVLRQPHRQSLAHAGLNTADGMPIVWAQTLLSGRRATRVYGPTLMMRLLERAERDGWRVGFYGGHPESLNVLVDRLRVRFPALQMACAISPPFRALNADEDRKMVQSINDSAPQLLFVGLGCPKQERWMFEHRESVRAVQLGVGAAFNFHAGRVRQAPAFMQRIGMEWFFRLLCEPRRLFRRYATTNPIYVVLFGLQLLSCWVLRRKYVAPLAAAPELADAAEVAPRIEQPEEAHAGHR